MPIPFLMPLLVISPLCETTGYAIKTNNLVGSSPTPTTSLKDPKTEGLYDVICGTTFKQVIQVLEKDGRALMNLGGFTGLHYWAVSIIHGSLFYTLQFRPG
jgi:hypothetical protein